MLFDIAKDLFNSVLFDIDKDLKIVFNSSVLLGRGSSYDIAKDLKIFFNSINVNHSGIDDVIKRNKAAIL